MAAIQDVTDESFESEVIESGVPVIVDFWGDHCPACRQIAPILEQLAGQHEGALKVVKIHAVENPGISARYGVRSMPTVLGFSGGQVCGQLNGARPRSAFEELIGRLG